jgi:hypothetical protein
MRMAKRDEAQGGRGGVRTRYDSETPTRHAYPLPFPRIKLSEEQFQK